MAATQSDGGVGRLAGQPADGGSCEQYQPGCIGVSGNACQPGSAKAEEDHSASMQGVTPSVVERGFKWYGAKACWPVHPLQGAPALEHDREL